MIVEALFTAFAAVVTALLSLLPAWTPIDLAGITADLASGPGSSVFAGLGWLNNYLPVDTMLALLTLSVTIWAATHVVRLTIWFLQLFHVAGGSS